MNMFQQKPSANPEQTLQIRSWVRQWLSLDENAVVMVSELHCSEPGCPPLETMVAVLEGPGKRRQFKFHKPIAEITSDDIDLAIRSA